MPETEQKAKLDWGDPREHSFNDAHRREPIQPEARQVSPGTFIAVIIILLALIAIAGGFIANVQAACLQEGAAELCD